MSTSLLETIGIQAPIILAPMGGGPGTPRLAAAVTNAGGLGSIAAGYLTPEQMRREVEAVRALTGGPLNVNLFAGGYHQTTDRDAAGILAVLAGIHETLGLPAPAFPDIPPDPFLEQVEMVLELRPRAFSVTFGIPPADVMARLRAAGIVTIGTATVPEEARLLADAGMDAIVLQGSEAGAHRGTFAVPAEKALVPTFELVRQVSADLDIPLIASGGIMTGADIAAALGAGASAVQLGTAFLLSPEAGTAAPYRRAIVEASEGETVLTRAFSGRAARGLRNRFIERIGERPEWILPFPIQNSLTRPMRAASARLDLPDYLSLWVGTGVMRSRALPAGELVKILMEELSAL